MNSLPKASQPTNRCTRYGTAKREHSLTNGRYAVTCHLQGRSCHVPLSSTRLGFPVTQGSEPGFCHFDLIFFPLLFPVLLLYFLDAEKDFHFNLFVFVLAKKGDRENVAGRPRCHVIGARRGLSTHTLLNRTLVVMRGYKPQSRECIDRGLVHGSRFRGPLIISFPHRLLIGHMLITVDGIGRLCPGWDVLPASQRLIYPFQPPE